MLAYVVISEAGEDSLGMVGPGACGILASCSEVLLIAGALTLCGVKATQWLVAIRVQALCCDLSDLR